MKLKRNIITIALSAIFALCLTFCLAFMPKQESTVYAEEQTSTFEMLGANVRLDANAGMRFTARLSEIDPNAEYGFIIFPADILTRFNVQIDKYSDSYDYLAAIGENAAAYISAMTARNPDFSYTLDCDPVPYYENEELVEYRLNATIAQVLYANLGRDFFGLAYKKTVENDVATYTYASFADGFKRSVVYVASKAYDLYAQGTDEKAIIDAFLQKNMYYLLEVPEATAIQNIENGESLPSVALTLNNTSATIALQDTFALTATAKISGYDVTLNYPVTYTSDNEQVATVSADGEITAVGEGDATITATCCGATADCSVTVTTAETYAINSKTVTHGTISVAATARENATVTVTATPDDGYALGFIRVDGERIDGNEFTMPAHAVSVDAVFVNAITYATVKQVTKVNNMTNETVTDGDDSITVTTKNDWAGQQDNSLVFEMNGGNGENTISMTVTNNATSATKNTLNLKISIMTGSDYTSGEMAISSVTNGSVGGGRNNAANCGAILNSIEKDGSLTTTIVLNNNIGTTNAYIKVCPQYSNTNYDTGNSFTISNIYFGTGAGGDAEVESYKTTVTNGSVDLIDAVPGETVTVTAAAPAGSDGFAYWSVVSGGVTLDDTSATETSFTMGDEAVQLKANYYYDIVLPATPEGIIAKVGGESVTKAVAGATVTIATTAEGYAVTGFEYDGTAATTTFTMPEEEVEITNVAVEEGVTTYSIKVNNGTASAAQAAKGTLITITANVPTGCNFTGWTVVSGGVTLGNTGSTETTFTMGEADVEVTATYAAAISYVTISSHEATDLQGNNVTTTLSADSKTLTGSNIKKDSKDDAYHYVGFQISGQEGKTTVTMTITNNGSTIMQGGLWLAQEKGNKYCGAVGISGVSGSGVTSGSAGGKDGVVFSIATGDSLTITITYSSSIGSGYQFRLLPYANAGFTGSVTVSNIYFG